MFRGLSTSLAEFVTTSDVRSPMIASVGAVSKAGGEFTSLMMTSNSLVVPSGGTPSSVTTVVMVFVPGPWSSAGIQMMIPLVGLMLAPVGGARRDGVQLFFPGRGEPGCR